MIIVDGKKYLLRDGKAYNVKTGVGGRRTTFPQRPGEGLEAMQKRVQEAVTKLRSEQVMHSAAIHALDTRPMRVCVSPISRTDDRISRTCGCCLSSCRSLWQ